MKRRVAREKALQALYQFDVSDIAVDEAIAQRLEGESVDDNGKNFIYDLVNGTIDNLDDIDSIIEKHARDWKVERMSIVDRNILRLAVYEMTYSKESPAKVALNEAIELGKTFGTDKSPKFINGVLGKIIGDLECS